MYRDDEEDPAVIVCQVGTTTPRYFAGGIEDPHAMLKKAGDWVPLGSADEGKPAEPGTVEEWNRVRAK